MGELFLAMKNPDAPKVRIIIHEFAMLRCILQHDNIDATLEKNLPL